MVTGGFLWCSGSTNDEAINSSRTDRESFTELSEHLLKRRLPYVKHIASPGSMHETGCSGLVHWDDPEGWAGERGGRKGQDGEHMYTHG